MATAVDDPVAERLVAAAEADICGRYRIPSIGTLVPAQFTEDHGGRFVVAWSPAGADPEGWVGRPPSGRAVGCGGVRRLTDEVAELKRLYVVPEARRRGVARAVLQHLQGWAAAVGYRELWLETGTEQPEALALYQAMGYRPVAPFRPADAEGHDERSRFLGRRLDGIDRPS